MAELVVRPCSAADCAAIMRPRFGAGPVMPKVFVRSLCVISTRRVPAVEAVICSLSSLQKEPRVPSALIPLYLTAFKVCGFLG